MADSELFCENCKHRLDPTDKFCRECGLPTLRRAETQAQVLAAPPPDTGEMQRALDAVPDPRPFLRPAPETDAASVPERTAEHLTTSDVVRATNPTFAAKLASSTTLMVGVMIVLAVAGVFFLVLAFRP
jgi:hypothetical protein